MSTKSPIGLGEREPDWPSLPRLEQVLHDVLDLQRTCLVWRVSAVVRGPECVATGVGAPASAACRLSPLMGMAWLRV